MTELTGYVLETLREWGAFVLYRGTQPSVRFSSAGASILALAPVATQHAAGTLARLEHEYSLAGELDPAWAVRPQALVRHDGRTMLVFNDPGGTPLDSILGAPLEVGHFLKLAVAAASAVGRAHASGLVHKDIKPSNLLVDAWGDVRLMGFGIASRLAREFQPPAPPEVIAGTFAYMAPEQTGRMNRSVDARSDLYSLGVTLYEMVTGVLPFTASDHLEWIHCHIARRPQPPGQRAEGIPDAISAIILKLLSKSAEDRYQTAAGLAADLRACLTAWEAQRHIPLFLLGSHDASDRLVIPERLYGREAEIDALVAAFGRVVKSGASELVLVSGHAGIGKSSLVNELHKTLVASRGLFAAGKFDQYKRGIPYATVAQAFQSLIRQVLGKSDSELDAWRAELLEALGPNGELMVNLIPELALIIGDQPPAPEVPPRDQQARFQLVFRRFLDVFARPEHPLTLFLDDLQWMDAATLALIEHLVTHGEVRHLLLVGAYRNNEVGPAHPLVRMLATIRGAGAGVREILLSPLQAEDLVLLLADALHMHRARVAPLAVLMFERTAGNPFFAIQFLIALAEEALLTFDPVMATWNWDLPRIQAKGFTDNVADLMASKLGRLPSATQKAMGQLACLGNAASMTTLTLIDGGAEETIHAALWDAVRAGLMLRAESTYTFLHDRIQEAAYTLIAESERASAHLRIGRLLAARTASEALEDHVFEIVNQFDRGAGLIAAPHECEQVAALNLMAGRRAKAATAYASALHYFSAGSALLGKNPGSGHTRLSFDLEVNRAECEYLTGDLASAEARLIALSERAANLVDRAAVTRLRMVLYTILDRTDRGVEVGLEYVRHVGIAWSPHPTDADVLQELARMRDRLAGRSIEELIDLPIMRDPDWLAVMDVLAELLPPARFTDNNLHDLVLLRIANLSLEHGNCDASSHAYTSLNIVLGIRLDDYQSGYRFGQLGCDLVERRGLARYQARVFNGFGGNGIPWARHLVAGRALIRRAFDTANAVGDLAYVVYSFKNLITNLLISGEPLGNVEQEAEQALVFARKVGFGLYADSCTDQLLLIRDLRGSSPDATRPQAGGQDYDVFERHLEAGGTRLALPAAWYWIHRMQASVFAQDHAAGIAALAKAESLYWATQSHLDIVEYHFYGALTRAAACSVAPAPARQEHFEALLAHHRKIAVWARNCPENFANREALVGAEIARLEGRVLDAMDLFDAAVRSAREHGFTQNEGLANERAAAFHAARGADTIAEAYLTQALACYRRWGADAKVRRMEQIHPQLRLERAAPRADSTIGTPVADLDLATVVKVSQAVSSEIDLKKLIDALMVMALEHAGGERGLLMLPRGGELRVEAEATTTGNRVEVRPRKVTVSSAELPESVLRYVVRTGESLLLDDASGESAFSEDAYVLGNRSRSILCMPLTKQTKLVGVLYLENGQASHVFTPARVAILGLLASQAAISLENAGLFSDLQHAEAHLAEAQRLSHMGSWVWNTATNRMVLSEEHCRILGFTRDQLRSDYTTVLESVHPEDLSRVRDAIQAAVRKREDFSVEFRVVLPDGSVKHIHSRGGPSAHEYSGAFDFTGTVMDVTERKRSEEEMQASLAEKDALLKEVHHRVKNNLQLISSLLSLQASRIADAGVAELFAESRNRVKSMALVHENLYRAGNFARVPMRTHIQNLCAQLFHAYGLRSSNVQLTTEIDDLELELDRAISAGLIINELVSNALKHAFPEGRAGNVRVELKLLAGEICALGVIDDGIGLPAGLDSASDDSLGLQLVRDLTHQLHGNITIARQDGTAFSVVFDANDAEAPKN